MLHINQLWSVNETNLTKIVRPNETGTELRILTCGVQQMEAAVGGGGSGDAREQARRRAGRLLKCLSELLKEALR